MTYTNFWILLKTSLAVIIENVDLALKVVIDSFKIYTINSLWKKLRLISLCESFTHKEGISGVPHRF